MTTNNNQSTAKAMLETFSGDYIPEGEWGGFIIGQRMPRFSSRWISDMLADQRVQLGLKMLKGPILSKARFFVNDPQSQNGVHSPIKKFICRQITRFWQVAASKAMDAFEWGYYGGEPLYRIRDDQIVFDNLKSFHARDVKVVTRNGKKAGVLVARVPGQNGRLYLGGPKSFWHIHNREKHPWYGLSALYGAFNPWMEFYTDGGAKDIRRLYFYKYAISGDVLYYPPADMPTNLHGPEGSGSPGGSVSNKARAKELLNKKRTGGTLALPNIYDGEGNRKWEYMPATGGPSPGPILEYHSDLKGELFEGMGIPPEVLDSPDGGGLGTTGRRIPQEAFYSMLQDKVNMLMYDYDEQILRELVALNFSVKNYEYDIIPFGLLQDSGADENANKEAARGGGGAGGAVPQQAKEESRFSIAV